MQKMKIKLYQRVAFTRDLPEHNLRKGDVAVVVEHLPATPAADGEEGYALAVFVVMVPASAVEPLSEDEILQVRRLGLTK